MAGHVDLPLLTPDDRTQRDDDLEVDVMMLWDDNGRAVASGTSYGTGIYLDSTDAPLPC